MAGCRSLRTRRTERTTSRLPRMEQRIIRQMATTIPVGINILRLTSVLPLLISENSCRLMCVYRLRKISITQELSRIFKKISDPVDIN